MQKLPLADVVTTHREQCNKNTITMVDLAMTILADSTIVGSVVVGLCCVCIMHVLNTYLIICNVSVTC